MINKLKKLPIGGTDVPPGSVSEDKGGGSAGGAVDPPVYGLQQEQRVFLQQSGCLHLPYSTQPPLYSQNARSTEREGVELCPHGLEGL